MSEAVCCSGTKVWYLVSQYWVPLGLSVAFLYCPWMESGMVLSRSTWSHTGVECGYSRVAPLVLSVLFGIVILIGFYQVSTTDGRSGACTFLLLLSLLAWP